MSSPDIHKYLAIPTGAPMLGPVREQITIKQVSEIVGKTPETITAWVKTGKFLKPIDFAAHGIPTKCNAPRQWYLDEVLEWHKENGDDPTLLIKHPRIKHQAVDRVTSLIEEYGGAACLDSGVETLVKRRCGAGRVSAKKRLIFADQVRELILKLIASQLDLGLSANPRSFEYKHGDRNSKEATSRADCIHALTLMGALRVVQRGNEGEGFSLYVQTGCVDALGPLFALLGINPVYAAKIW
jgi:hypothetical protein